MKLIMKKFKSRLMNMTKEDIKIKINYYKFV